MGLSLQTSWLDPRKQNEPVFFVVAGSIPVILRSLGLNNSCAFSVASAFSSVSQH